VRTDGSDDTSVHLEFVSRVPAAWRDDKLAEKWRKVRLVRRVVTGALEIARAGKRIGSSLEADPVYDSEGVAEAFHVGDRRPSAADSQATLHRRRMAAADMLVRIGLERGAIRLPARAISTRR